MSAGQDELALFAFIGGFSSATSMVIVACIALSIMISNHIVMPVLLRIPWLSASTRWNVKSMLLNSRRISIAVMLLLGWLYYRVSNQSDALAAIGLISFAGVAQFLPAMLGGLFWRGGTARGAIAGLSAGCLVWAYTLLLPSLERSGWAFQGLIGQGPFGIQLLRPEALFGAEGWDPLVHALFWSLSANVFFYIAISLVTVARPLERLQGSLFVDVFRNVPGREPRIWRRSAAVEDLYTLAERIIGPEQAVRIFADYARGQGGADTSFPDPDPEFIAFVERQLAGSIGAASARSMVSLVATGETLSLSEVMKILDETQQAIAYSHQLEEKSRELETTARQLRNANEQLKRLDIMKDDFLSRVSHEVRTPMTSIRSFSEILMSEELDREQTTRFVRIIHDESLRLTRLLDEILDINRLESGTAEMPVEPVEADAALTAAIDTLRPIARDAGVEIVPHAPVEGRVRANPDRLRQVLINLISNAIKYNGADAPRVEFAWHVEGHALCLDVIDNGGGVSREEADRIFSKFVRGTRSGAAQGAGLGLPISRAAIRRMGGDLSVVFAADQTSFFRLRLPRAGQPAAERGGADGSRDAVSAASPSPAPAAGS